ncbi:MAG: adenylyl-sulfate kinase [Kiritimatiellae bacterium]|nr:adenylyl-sulfate kinase [Kiritimatiellia bacterium]
MLKNIVWNMSEVIPEERAGMLGQRGCVLWLTGLSGSGKSTIARALEKSLIQEKRLAYVLDGDNMRHGLNKDLGFTEKDRNENIRRIIEVSNLFADCGVICISAFISPFRAIREQAKQIIGPDRFFEIYLSTSLKICEQRDPKGLYKRARRGDIQSFTGIDSPYESPDHPDLRMDTETLSVDECVEPILSMLSAYQKK